VFADNTGSVPAIEGSASKWDGIYGHGALNGVIGRTAAHDHSGVFGHNTGDGYGVAGHTQSGADRAGVFGLNRGDGPGVIAESVSGTGLFGTGASNGVDGRSSNAGASGVYGQNNVGGYGVTGDTTSNASRAAVYGRNNGTGPGVHGLSVNSNGAGVSGQGATGVSGESTTGGDGVYGVTSSNLNTSAGVSGLNYGTGPAVFGEGVRGYGKLGVHGIGSGDGVLGEGLHGVHGKSVTTNYNAVWGQGTGEARGVAGTSTAGYGGYFQGGKAQLRLAPINILGKPTTGAHLIGELFLDSAAALWICTVSGTPGTWRRVSTTAT